MVGIEKQIACLVVFLLVIFSILTCFGVGGLGAYFPVEYVFLTGGNHFIPWEKVRMYAFNHKAQLISLDFEGPEWISPAVMQTFDLVQIARVLRAKAPGKDMTADIQIG